ncbi:MAG: hypothetical protein JSV22_10670 [Bacteroidales bacterium]|nr:MAG: hypothetical protein JSV22_10670 [Bacteroidales bacterium]
MELPRNVLGKATINFEEENILIIKILPNASIDLDTAKAIVEAAEEIAGSSMHGNIVDIREMVFMSRDARQFFADQTKSNVIAIAILMKSIFHNALVNLYLDISRPGIPTKAFEKDIDAIDWLREKLIQNTQKHQ